MGQIISSFLDQSFRIPGPTLTEKNLPDQHGKVFIVTGSNTGVGYHLASILYQHNATIYIAARTESKAVAAISKLQALHANSTGRLEYLHLDLSDLSSIKASAESFLRKESRLDVLWNNAGVMIPPNHSTSAQGFDLTYATNILGPYLFTKLLLPILRSTATESQAGSVRVCWAGSLGIDVGAPRGGADFDAEGNLNDYKMTNNQKTYAVSKTANYFLAHEFGRRSGTADHVLHTTFNPGNLETELQRHANDAYGVANRLLDFLLYPGVYGAYTELYAGLSGDLGMADQGVFIKPWGRKGGVRSDIAAECKVGGKSELLWSWCEKETVKYS